jgi:hypothetical protein
MNDHGLPLGEMTMTKKEITMIAREMGIKPGKKRKSSLILEIQKTEGNFPCFGTAFGECDQGSCLWRADCLGK